MLASAGVHVLSTACLLAAWFAGEYLMPLDVAGDASTTQVLEITMATDEPQQPLTQLHAGRDEMLISPRVARMADHRFVETSSAQVRLEELLSPEVLEVVLAQRLFESEQPTLKDQESPFVPRESLLAMLPDAARPTQQTAPPEQKSSTNDSRQGLSPPRFDGNQPPRYPAQAVRQRLEGVVMLRLTLAADGRVTEVRVVESSGHDLLDAAAVATVRTWKGRPATRGGQPVSTIWDMPVRFKLN